MNIQIYIHLFEKKFLVSSLIDVSLKDISLNFDVHFFSLSRIQIFLGSCVDLVESIGVGQDS